MISADARDSDTGVLNVERTVSPVPADTRNDTTPVSVNFSALESRFLSI